MKTLVNLIFGICGVIIAAFLINKDSTYKDVILKTSIGILIATFINVIIFILENRKRWNQLATILLKPSKKLRITMAYLFRIEVNGKYVLIKRHKKDRVGFQPVGGAFKYYKEENRELFDKLGVIPCNLIERDEDTDNDLRVILNKRRKLLDFLKWFDGKKNREIDPTREFREELIEPGLLPPDIFKHIHYVFIGKTIEGPLKSPIYPIDEIRYAEIYELRLENDAQKQAINRLIDHNNEIIFATADEIQAGRTQDGKPILPHTYKILHL